MSQQIQNRVGELLAAKKASAKHKITHQEVADAIGVNRTTVDRYVLNQVTRFDAPVLLAFCNYFGIGLSNLLVIVEAKDAPNNPEANALLDAIPA